VTSYGSRPDLVSLFSPLACFRGNLLNPFAVSSQFCGPGEKCRERRFFENMKKTGLTETMKKGRKKA